MVGLFVCLYACEYLFVLLTWASCHVFTQVALFSTAFLLCSYACYNDLQADMKITRGGEAKKANPREEWMTELPPEFNLTAKGATSTESRTFLGNGRESRGDVSTWTDTPEEKKRKVLLSLFFFKQLLAIP